ncbi:MAG: nuclear transport factor 2 family protein [Chitinispirillia bacterium]|nr:nuclear transport factor 2 family protein [Chitinispirillia bacterium]MCL2269175.1 nuclear transport factor 2 family protein [Chitinispirillia bacterium]
MINTIKKSAAAAAASLLICLLCPACSIFDMKTPEAPLTSTVIEDELNIGDIIRIARESAVNMDYRDYFTESATFEYTLFRRIEGREPVVQMLNRLRTQASLVQWQAERANKRFEGNRQIVENVPYTVYFGGRQVCTGRADFHFVREPDWVISYWKDVPDGNAPFFEP